MDSGKGVTNYGLECESLAQVGSSKETWESLLDPLEVTDLGERAALLSIILRDQDNFFSLKDGIPPLVPQISLSPPSVPPPDAHAPLIFIEKVFGELREKEFERISDSPSRSWADYNYETESVSYGSENDVAGLVIGLIKDIVKAIGLDLQTHTEIGTFGECPDVWVVTWNMIPIGVIKVKKPDEEVKATGDDILNEPTVLGELYNFQMKLPNFYGVRPAFGILTTFETWRICWIPEKHVHVDNMAESLESLPQRADPHPTPKKQSSGKQKSSPPGTTTSKTTPVLHSIEAEAEEGTDVKENNNESENQTGNDPRVLHGSKIYRRTDENHLAMRAIAAALCKMTKVKRKSLGSPFDNIDERMILRFTRGSARSIHWCRMGRVVPKWNKYANPIKYLFAIEDLGRGSDGRVWLTCSSSGAVCVLKFPIRDKYSQDEDVASEFKNWNDAYPEFKTKVFHEKWCGHDALRMPHFAAVHPDRRLNILDRVRACLESHFLSKRLIHQDVAWRNIGLYKDGEGEERAVVFDLCRVRDMTDREQCWVEKAIAKLERDA